jgi:carbon storage regulator
MLVLRRKVGESLVIAQTITLSVLAVEGERVKLGIQAPDAVPIVRQELLPAAETNPPQEEQADKDA